MEHDEQQVAAGSGKDTGLDEYMHVYIHSTIYLFVSNHLMTTQRSTNFREKFKLTDSNYFFSLGTTTSYPPPPPLHNTFPVTVEGESQTLAGTAFLYPRKNERSYIINPEGHRQIGSF
jgi:hypothetical protein